MRQSLPIALVLLFSVLMGCEQDTAETRVVDRRHIEQPSEHLWISSPWPWDSLEPESDGLIEIKPQSRIELIHDLGRMPLDVRCFVGFSRDASWLMPSAGNACEIRDVNEESITIENGSGGQFFYRFVLQ